MAGTGEVNDEYLRSCQYVLTTLLTKCSCQQGVKLTNSTGEAVKGGRMVLRTESCERGMTCQGIRCRPALKCRLRGKLRSEAPTTYIEGI